MEIIDRIPVNLSAGQVLRHLHLDEDGKYAGDVQELVEMTQPLIHPKAVYDVCYIDRKDNGSVEINGVTFTSRVLRANLDKVERVFPYIVTCGTEVESVEVESDDLMGKFVLDTIKQMALRVAAGHLRKHIEEKFRPGKMSSMNPGSLEDWPISEQKQLFSIFGDVESLIGVRLTDTFLMLPLKSISGVYFPKEIKFVSCQLCPRERCSGRRAPYDEELKKQYLSA